MEQYRAAPLSSLGDRPTPAALHFLRSHFPYPEVGRVVDRGDRRRGATPLVHAGRPNAASSSDGDRRAGVRRASPHRALASRRRTSVGCRRGQPGDLERPCARPRARAGRPRTGGDPGRVLRRRRRRRIRARDLARQGARRGDDARARDRGRRDPGRAGRAAPRDRPRPLRRGLGQVAAAHRGRRRALPRPLPVGGLLPLRRGGRPGRHRAERAAGHVARHRHGAEPHRGRRLGRRDRPRRGAGRRRAVGRSRPRRSSRPVRLHAVGASGRPCAGLAHRRVARDRQRREHAARVAALELARLREQRACTGFPST